MTYARRHLLDLRDPGWVHCVSRCVRRAFLVEGDSASSSRKTWVEQRLGVVGSVFSCRVAAYAVMSNHLHVVVRMDPTVATQWSAEEVVRRWWTLFPGRGRVLVDGSALAADPVAVTRQAADEAWVAQRRGRLCHLSWFMKALKEGISRRANREDDCTGAFWEARFTSVPLLDEGALMACMAYVDLNPIRAGMADRPERSAHTSARGRISARQRARTVVRIRAEVSASKQARALTRAGVTDVAAPGGNGHPESRLWLAPIGRCLRATTVDDYLQLVDATGRLVRGGKRGTISPQFLPILARLDLSAEQWLGMVTGSGLFSRGCVGSVAARAAEAARRGVAWVRSSCSGHLGGTASRPAAA